MRGMTGVFVFKCPPSFLCMTLQFSNKKAYSPGKFACSCSKDNTGKTIIIGKVMINLTNKAAQRFKVAWKSLEERSGDFWKIDLVMNGRVPMLLIVHEYTLFTLVRRKSQFRTPEDIREEIKISCPWYKTPEACSLGKNGNRKLTGSINEIKRLTDGLYSPEQINAMEMSINNCLFSYLSAGKNDFRTPFKAVESYVKGLTPWRGGVLMHAASIQTRSPQDTPESHQNSK